MRLVSVDSFCLFGKEIAVFLHIRFCNSVFVSLLIRPLPTMMRANRKKASIAHMVMLVMVGWSDIK